MVGVVLRGGGSGRVQMDEDVVSNWRGGSVLLIGGVSSGGVVNGGRVGARVSTAVVGMALPHSVDRDPGLHGAWFRA